MKLLLILFTFLIQAKSLKDLTNECISSDANSCFEAAYLSSQNGQQLEPLNLYKRGCELKDGKSCYAVDKFLKKLGQLKNDDKFVTLSCDYGFSIACYEVGEILFKKQSFLDSIYLLEKSCSLKNELACKRLDVLKPYFSKVVRSAEKELNENEKKDQAQYLKLLKEKMIILQKSCESKAYKDCTDLAKNYLFLANVKDARKWAEVSCRNKIDEGCLVLGEVEQKEGKTQLVSFEKACDMENGVGCFRFAQSLEQGNLARAMTFYRRSCEAKVSANAQACEKYSKYHKSSPKLSMKYKKKACEVDKTLCEN
jgi:TPR repeat protein